MLTYTFADGPGPLTIKNARRADPQKIGEEFERIRQANGGRLRKRDVVATAASARNVLHRHFEWDNEKAAASHRLDQANELIRCIRVVEVNPETRESTKQFAFLSVTDKRGTAYYATGDVLLSTDLQLAVLNQADRDLAAFEKRYKELLDICALVQEAREKVRQRRAELRVS